MEVPSGFKVSLKLLIDTKGQKVLFAEADKKAVDFLFHILTLPIGTVIRLLTKQQMVGSLANLYDSVENLSETYIQPNQAKETFLKPISPVGATNFSNPLLTFHQAEHKKVAEKISYRCSTDKFTECYSYFSDNSSAVCLRCNNPLSLKMTYVAPPEVMDGGNKRQKTDGGGAVGSADAEGGFVKGVVTYMVMDDLVVKPMSTISSIALLNKLNVKEVGALEEKVVDLGITEALSLLKTSLSSKAVLSTVFLKNMK